MATALLCGTIALAGPCPSITGARADTCYPGGPLPPNYTLNGDATFSGTHLVITPDLQDQNASVMLNPVFSTAGDLHVKLVLRITTSTGAGADGMALVLHSDPRGVAAIGQPGRGMGYGLQNSPTPMITPSVVVEFDTHRNNELGDPSDNHVAITLDGNPDHDAFPSSYRQNLGSGLTLKSNAPVYVWLDYASASHGLSLYLSSTDTKPTASTLGVSGIDLAARLGASLWLGFTGSTGGAQSKHEVLEFYASDTLVAPDSTCCSADAQCTSSPQGPVCDLRKHVCGECTEADTSHCPSQAPACDEMNGRCVACLVDADCLADHWCHHEACLPRLAHGELLPGSCATLGARACRSGVCEASDDRCGFLNAPSSTGDCAGDPARCRSGRCDVDGHCGLANGHGPCSAASGATDCRSAVCDEAAALCGNPRGAGCGSAAECSTLLCADAVCCDAACEESCDACDLPGSTGTCTPASARAPGAPTCAPFACDGVTTRCPTECATDSACPDGRYCDASHQCLPQKAVGLACASAHECSGGNCVDGFCCDGACTGQCLACDVPAAPGTCSPISGAPHGARPPCAGAGSACEGTCDGTEPLACTYPGAELACRSAGCEEGVSSLGATCDGAGTCPLVTLACAPYHCGVDACLTTCTSSGDCVEGYYCDGQRCRARLADGRSCDDAEQCLSARCVDGVCCDGPCDGQCEACDLAGSLGRCSAVSGEPRGERAQCSGQASCQGLCDGTSRASCTFPGSSRECAPASCLAGILSEAATCDGQGGCAQGPTLACASGECIGSACACELQSDCPPGFVCAGDRCARMPADAGVTEADAGTIPSDDGVPMYSLGGCGCGQAAGGSGAAGMLLALLGLLATRRRRGSFSASSATRRAYR